MRGFGKGIVKVVQNTNTNITSPLLIRLICICGMVHNIGVAKWLKSIWVYCFSVPLNAYRVISKIFHASRIVCIKSGRRSLYTAWI